MKKFVLLGLAFLWMALAAMLASCDGRTGYLDDGQAQTVGLLTDAEWLVAYADYGMGSECAFDVVTSVYAFGNDMNGWTATGSLRDASLKEDVRYFRWTFTTENYAVIRTAGNSTDGYWLIKKLTQTEMWLQWSLMDPVIYPNQTTTLYKFKARKRP